MTAGPEAYVTDPLAPHHLDDLRKSGLTIETALAAGIYSADADDVATMLGFDTGPGLVFPYPGTVLIDGTPFRRVKPDKPFTDSAGNVAKYLSPKRSRNPAGNRLYLPPTLDPLALSDPGRTLLITEGEKKVLAAYQAGFDAVGFAGVWAWRKRDDDDQSQPIEDLSKIDWRGRTVLIIFDSDAATNPQVQAAERAVKHELTRRRAVVSIVRLPEPTFEESRTWGAKFGMDDFIHARGRGALADLIDAAVNSLPLGCRTLAALLGDEDKPLLWLVDGIWPSGGCGFFAGEPKSQKSFLSNYLALAVAHGMSFLGRSVLRGPVVMVDEENDRAEVKRRLKQTARGLGLDPRSNDIYIAAPTVFRLDDDAGIEEMDELLARVKPILVILDPLVRLHGSDENDTASVSRLLGKVRRLKNRHGCAFIIVHHLRKKTETKTSLGQRMRGSSDLHGWLDAAVYFEALPDDRIRVSFESRYAKPADPLVMKLWDQPDESLRWEVIATVPQEEAKTARDLILLAVGAAADGLDRDGIRERTGLSRNVVAAELPGLLEVESIHARRVRTGGKPREVFFGGPAGDSDLPSVPSPPLGGGENGKKSGPTLVPPEALNEDFQ